jgi:hypothetical protein
MGALSRLLSYSVRNRITHEKQKALATFGGVFTLEPNYKASMPVEMLKRSPFPYVHPFTQSHTRFHSCICCPLQKDPAYCCAH